MGQGGLAAVYRAYDPRFERAVAIRMLPREFLHDRPFNHASIPKVWPSKIKVRF